MNTHGVSLDEASSILDGNVFGPDLWNTGMDKYFGVFGQDYPFPEIDDSDLPIPPIPWTKEQLLKAKEKFGTLFLFLGRNETSEDTNSPNSITPDAFIQMREGGDFDLDHGPIFAFSDDLAGNYMAFLEFRWYCMASWQQSYCNLSYLNQERVIKRQGYVVASNVEIIAANALFWILTEEKNGKGKYFIPETYLLGQNIIRPLMRCAEYPELVIGVDETNGILMNADLYASGGPFDNVSMAVSLRP